MRSCWESGAAWNTMPYPAPGLGKLWAAHVHKEEGWLMEFLHKAKLPSRWMNTAPTQRRRLHTTTSIRAGSSLRMCICEYSRHCLCVRVCVRLRVPWKWELLLEGWVESWRNWLGASADRQSGYGMSSAGCLRKTAPSSPGDSSLPPTLRTLPRRWAVGHVFWNLSLYWSHFDSPEGPVALKFKLPSPSPYTQLRNRPNWD